MTAHGLNYFGRLVISLDFEMHWGMQDLPVTRRQHLDFNAIGIVVDQILALFVKYNIHATWAVVGKLYKEPLASALIDKIRMTPGQEIGSHSYSHLCVMDDNVNDECIQAEYSMALDVANQAGDSPVAVVFPRNQYTDTVLDSIKRLGFSSYRKALDHWLYAPQPSIQLLSFSRRFLRLLYAYFPITRNHVVEAYKEKKTGLVAIPESCFLRPCFPMAGWLDCLRLWKIKRGMRRAACTGKLYHIWWHPHNFLSYTDQNLHFLEQILSYFTYLQKTYGMQSCTMGEAAAQVETV